MAFNPHAKAKISSSFDPHKMGANIVEEHQENPSQFHEEIPQTSSNNKDIQKQLQFLDPSHITKEDIVNRTKGLLQGAENVGIGYANLFPNVNISKANWAGESPQAKQG